MYILGDNRTPPCSKTECNDINCNDSALTKYVSAANHVDQHKASTHLTCGELDNPDGLYVFEDKQHELCLAPQLAQALFLRKQPVQA